MAVLRIDLDADIAAVAQLADEAGAFAAACGLGDEAVSRLLTVLDEVVTNVVAHAGLAAGATIGVELRQRRKGLGVVVEDEGPPFDPLSEARPPVLSGAATDRPIGGLGIFLLQGLASEVAYLRTPQGRNRLSFHVA